MTPVVDDLPQGLADTVADLIGKPRARGWIHLCSAGCHVVLVANERVQRISLFGRADDGEPSRVATTRE